MSKSLSELLHAHNTALLTGKPVEGMHKESGDTSTRKWRWPDGSWRPFPPPRHRGVCNPEWESVFLAVHPEQIEAARERIKAAGGGDVEFRPDGTPIITCQKQHDRICRAYGYHRGAHGKGLFDEHDQPIPMGKEPEQNKERYKRELREKLAQYPEAPPPDPQTLQRIKDHFLSHSRG